MYKQLVKPNVHIPAQPGWCLTYVQETFKAPWAGSTATDGWNRAEYKHVGQTPPKGVSVPVWFAMRGEPAGHVVTWMEDGSIWSASDNDPQADYHPNLQHLLDFYGGRLTLRGWSEDIGGLRIVRKEDDMTTQEAHDVGVAVYRAVYGREPENSTVAKNMGWSLADKNGNLTPKSVIAGLQGQRKAKEWKERQTRAKSKPGSAGYEEVKETLYRRKK